MGYIKFLNDDTKYEVVSINKSSYSENAVRVEFEGMKVENTHGFNFYLGNRIRSMGNYENYTHIFKNDEINAIEYSTIDEKYVSPTKDVEISISWDDEDNIDGIRPNTVEISVFINDVFSHNVLLSNSNDWKVVLYRLNVNDECYITQPDIYGYTSSIDGTTISNHHTLISDIKKNKKNDIESDSIEYYQNGIEYDGETYPYDSKILEVYERALVTKSPVEYNGNILRAIDLANIYIRLEERKFYAITLADLLNEMVDQAISIEEINDIYIGMKLDAKTQKILDDKCNANYSNISSFVEKRNYTTEEESTAIEEAIIELYEMIASI